MKTTTVKAPIIIREHILNSIELPYSVIRNLEGIFMVTGTWPEVYPVYSNNAPYLVRIKPSTFFHNLDIPHVI